MRPMKVRYRNGMPVTSSATTTTGIQTKAEPMSPIFITMRNGTAAIDAMREMRAIGDANHG